MCQWGSLFFPPKKISLLHAEILTPPTQEKSDSYKQGCTNFPKIYDLPQNSMTVKWLIHDDDNMEHVLSMTSTCKFFTIPFQST